MCHSIFLFLCDLKIYFGFEVHYFVFPVSKTRDSGRIYNGYFPSNTMELVANTYT